ncbi:MAG: hypothetical protein KTR31_02895 [Myxococcales bacterium]|nr:hypothetical protein [Myxococcales bacterium]
MSWFPVVLSLLLPGCAQLAPGRVAEGVAQLTVRDLGGVLLAVNEDATCGFASPAVDGSPEVVGALGGPGTASWTVQDCTIDLGPELVELATDCNGVTTSARGAFTISVVKELQGHYTGDPATPVIPTRPDAVTFEVQRVDFADFEVVKATSDSAMRIVQGTASASLKPQLGLDDTDGACSVATPNLDARDILLTDATAVVTSGKRVFDVDVQRATLDATNGVVGEHENRVDGVVTVWGKAKAVSLSGPADGLDPDYDRAVHEASYQCLDGLAQPVRFECPLEPTLVEGVARLVVKNIALVTKETDLDTSCGFSSFTEQLWELISSGALGGLFTGELETIVLDAVDCQLGGALEPIYTDCLDTEYLLDGTVVVTASKTVTGKVSLSANPLQPQDRRSAVIQMDEIQLTEATVVERRSGTSQLEPGLTMHDGTLSGIYLPVTGEADDTPGAYFVVIPVGEWHGVRLVDSDVTLRQGAMQFPMHVDHTELYAFTGGYLDEANWLYGTVTVDGTVWEIGGADRPIALDPEYDQAQFDLSYECIDNLREVVPVTQ